MTETNPYRCVELLASSLHLLYKLARGGKHHDQDHSDAERISTAAAEALAVPTEDDALAEQLTREIIEREVALGYVTVGTRRLRSLVRIIDHARAGAAAAGELAEQLRRAQRKAVELEWDHLEGRTGPGSPGSGSGPRRVRGADPQLREIASGYGWDPDWLFPRGRESKDANALAGWLHGRAREAVKPWPLRGELADEGRSVDQLLISPGTGDG